MEKKYSCRICKQEDGRTVKQILTGKWKLGSGQIKKAKFRENGILVNGKRVTVRHVLKEGEFLEVLLEEKSFGSSHLIPVTGDLHILYEDADLLAVEKPAGLVCHPSGGHYCDSMANLVVGYFAGKGEGYVVRLAGRLDKGTSGILLYAKHAPALTDLERQRADGRMRKEYLAILEGCPDQEKGVIDQPIGPDPAVPMKQRVCSTQEGGLHSLTRYEICGKSGDRRYALARVTIETGRTHQIRTHMSWLGYQLVGDILYGGSAALSRPSLHAGKLAIEHPVYGKKLQFYSALPADMQSFLEAHF